MIQAYIGNGKGKTTASIGLLIRAFGFGKKVFFISFDKGSKTYTHSESVIFDRLGIDYHFSGLERMLPNGTFRFENTDDDKIEALKGFEIAIEAIKSNKYDIIVLDEALSAVEYNLLDDEKILKLIKYVPESLELILTGRCTNADIIQNCHLVTSMDKIKHYFDQGVKARPGIEY